MPPKPTLFGDARALGGTKAERCETQATPIPLARGNSGPSAERPTTPSGRPGATKLMGPVSRLPAAPRPSPCRLTASYRYCPDKADARCHLWRQAARCVGERKQAAECAEEEGITCPTAIIRRYETREQVREYLAARGLRRTLKEWRNGRWIGHVSRDDGGFWVEVWLLAA